MDSTRSKPLSVAPIPQRAQNQQEHISRMPPELLVNIFKFDLGALNSPRKPKSGARLSRIISLSSVCSCWRTAALGTSSFWTCIPLHFNNNLIAACVARAGDMPLEVVGVDRNIGIITGEPWPGADALGDHAHKIHSLALVTNSLHRIHPVIRWTLEPTVPCLRELSVALFAYSSVSLFETESKPRIDALARQLHTFSLYRINVDWMEHSFDNLRVLKLNCIIHVFTINEIRHIAATSPMLEVLELTTVELDDTLIGLRTTGELPVFPYLQTLRLSYTHSLHSYASVFSKGSHSVELVVDTFNLGTEAGSLHFCRLWRTVEDMKEMFDHLGRITLLGIGRSPWSCINPEKFLRAVVRMSPDLGTLRFEKIELGRAAFTEILDATQWSRQVKTVQMKHVDITDAEAFKFMIGHVPGSVELIELIECCYIEDDTKVPITPGTLSHEPSSQSTPKIRFLER